MKQALSAAVAWFVFAASNAAAQGAGNTGNAGAGGGGWGWGWWWVVLFFIVVVAIIAGASRGTPRRGRTDIDLSDATLPPDEALDILKRRYAKGEISKAEYEEKRRDLEERLVGPRSR